MAHHHTHGDASDQPEYRIRVVVEVIQGDDWEVIEDFISDGLSGLTKEQALRIAINLEATA